LFKVIQRDWLLHHPPRDLSEPYHLRLLISYAQKDQGHEGTVYKAAGMEQWGETQDGEKWIYLERLPEPDWTPTAQLTLINN